MSKRSQKQKADDLLRFHTNGDLLVLPNVWNPIGARILAAKGYPAVATASAALSASLGYADGERIQRATLIEFIGRIARSVEVPVTADIEAGYAGSLTELEETIRQVIESGIVGINLEDSLEEGGALRPVSEQCRRISLVRQVAERSGLHLVVNARVDCFLSSAFPDKTLAMQETVARAKAYFEAGADCLYPIGPGDEATVRELRDRISNPINILASPKAAPLSVLRRIGVNRVSFGPFVFQACLRTFVDIVEALRTRDGYDCFGNLLSGADVAPYLIQEHEQLVKRDA
jgi:2-methylisocitrate lyase-like PEP mutase family enzyme